MRVKHVHARSGEYVAVHRPKGYHRGPSKSSGDTGMGACILWIIAACLIYCYWAIIVKLLIVAGGLYVAYVFRKELASVCVKGWKSASGCWSKIFGKKKPAAIVPPAAKDASEAPSAGSRGTSSIPTYGKIIQIH